MLASIFLLFSQFVHAFPAPTKDSTLSAFVESSLLLTSANWTTEIGKGSWFIEFYTPISQSCKELAPIWQELTSNKDILRTGYPDAPLSLAQVDCNAEQALCVREGVTHIPKLSLYKDGIQTESEFTGNREYTELAAFVDSEAASYRKSKGVSDIAHPLEASTGSTAANAAPGNGNPAVNAPVPGAGAGDGKEANKAPIVPPKQDTIKGQAIPVPPPPTVFQRPNPQGRVLQFGIDEAVKDKQALQEFLSKNENHGATFVKFFAPWCPHCRAMAGAFRQIGEALKDRVSVVEVDCEANHAVCVSYSIQGFPTLRMYNDGESTEYRGGRSFDAMRTWALKAGSASGVRQISAKEIHDISRNDEVFFLYLHEEGVPEKEVDAVTRASRILLTTPVHVYRSSDAELIQRYRSRLSKASVGTNALSGLLVFKDHDDTTPTASLHPSEERSKGKDLQTSITSWLDSERFPSIVEVTGNTFSEVINNRQNTPVVLAALSDVYH
ncbi:thioredoxin-domain-containing protein, partial [Meira miltonrushii]